MKKDKRTLCLCWQCGLCSHAVLST